MLSRSVHRLAAIYRRSFVSLSCPAHAKVLIFDTETTGFADFKKTSNHPSQPHLVQLGMIAVDSDTWAVHARHSLLLSLPQDVEISEGAEKIHGISKEQCTKYGVEPNVAMFLFAAHALEADLVVAHNLAFDELVVQAAFGRSLSGEVFPFNRKLCTMKTSTDILKLPGKYGNYKYPSLAEAHSHFCNGESIEDAHDALVDSEACLRVLKGLVDSGAVNLEEIMKEKVEGDDDFKSWRRFMNGTEMSEEKRFVKTIALSTSSTSSTTTTAVLSTDGLTLTSTPHGKIVTGQKTYQYKSILKDLGGRWDGKMKGWIFVDSAEVERRLFNNTVS
jgi:DNA polymerase III epsilon subunit-like protein